MEWVHLDRDGHGTTKIEEDLVAGRRIFHKRKFGGVQARAVYAYLAEEQDRSRWETQDDWELGNLESTRCDSP